jgi:uncharacterized membrane protein HdeD (DUF308 family)
MDERIQTLQGVVSDTIVQLYRSRAFGSMRVAPAAESDLRGEAGGEKHGGEVMNTASMSLPGFAKKSITWSIILSILMILAGFLAIIVPPVAALAVTVLVGWLLVFSGLMHFVYAWHTRSAGTIIWEILVGVLYVVVGGYLLLHPLAGMAGLTLALAFYLFAEAALEFILGFRLRARRGSGWLFLDGVITLILAAMIWRTWPSSTDWALGILVGFSMLFSGVSRLSFSMAARRLVAGA